MHLKQLKLAGFKSFVDPTVIPFPSQLVGIVGPNGCGKSNIIDAVRWVMGERFARHLRGEAMTDVIFKGSSHRKSVGQAFVELIFDNRLGRLTGPYASYAEISVKRLVTQDGDNQYFLNGTRCRRRDITDIFLGTGANARGYAIIGQDTISRLIEARPDDLRTYLEEAAGVSKYKDRRREALQRLEKTREHLSRVVDIRDELQKQLNRLTKQAETARMYHELRALVHQCRIQVLALKQHRIVTDQIQLRQSHQIQLIADEAEGAAIASLIQDIHAAEQTLQQQTSTHQTIQTMYYQCETDIARLEEMLQQQQRDRQRIDLEQCQLDAEHAEIQKQVKRDQLSLLEAKSRHQDAHAQRQQLEAMFESQSALLQEAERVGHELEVAYQTLSRQWQHLTHEIQLTDVALTHLSEREHDLKVRLEKNELSDAALDLETLEQGVRQLEQQMILDKVMVDEAQAAYEASGRQRVDLEQRLIEADAQLHHDQSELRDITAMRARLSAAQAAAYQAASHGHLEGLPRWVECINIAQDWLPVCEQVLREILPAVVVETLEPYWDNLIEYQGKNAIFLQKKSSKSSEKHPRLLDKISGMLPTWVYPLEAIFTAESLAEGLTWLPTLAPHESVLTRDGLWFGPGWIRVFELSMQSEEGFLARQDALRLWTAREAEQELRVEQQRSARASLYQQCVVHAQNEADAKSKLSQLIEHYELQARALRHQQADLDHAIRMKDTFVEEKSALLSALETLILQQEENRARRLIIENEREACEQKKVALLVEKDAHEPHLKRLQQALEEQRSMLHEVSLVCQRESLQIDQLNRTLATARHQLVRCSDKMTALTQQLTQLNPSECDHQGLLNEKIAQHTQLERQLSEQRETLLSAQQALQDLLQARQQREHHRHQIQAVIQSLMAQEQVLCSQLEALEATGQEWSIPLSECLSHCPTEMTLMDCEAQLEALNRQIQELGAINLLAIDEYDQALERHAHLDAQYHDLTDALKMLESAIKKMDQETELRLQETFDAVNTAFQSLFPRLFGGGHARLDWTSHDLLEAGVLVMAQPPGKRNSTIHLLSGGEKAMTAVALVFAIFQLNPSPFCFLDEVDAPLDDTNVGRFCELVRELSHCVQFLFITHNKVTMALAEHLIGVTMREPGVSRVVSVDIEHVLSKQELLINE